jgi:carbonic anhydrase
LEKLMSSEVLEGLKAGIRRFRSEVYPAQAEMYVRAAIEPQLPSALIIACADSRVRPETITQSGPGELFVTRNIGNMVPAYGEMMGGVSAVVEFAVMALKVKHIAICGHSECGAMKELHDPKSVVEMPAVTNWLKNAHTALSVTKALAEEGEDINVFKRRLTEQNVLLQMQHLRTHPSVAGAMAKEELTISGWVYEIGSGEVRICEEGGKVFEPVMVEGVGGR